MELVAQQHIQVPSSSVSGVAVCYRCSYQSRDCGSSCPECSFPMIVQSGLVSAELGKVRASLRIGAPPLPGVHSTPRKAQLLAEARKRMRDTARQDTKVDTRADTEPGARRSVWGLVSVCCFAVGFGIVAAAVQSVL